MQPAQTFKSVHCQTCGAIVALLPPASVTHTTHLRCPHCGTMRTIRKEDSKACEVLPGLIVSTLDSL